MTDAAQVTGAGGDNRRSRGRERAAGVVLGYAAANVSLVSPVASNRASGLASAVAMSALFAAAIALVGGLAAVEAMVDARVAHA